MYCLVEIENWGDYGNCVHSIVACSRNKQELDELKTLLSNKFKDKKFDIIDLNCD